MRLPSESTPYVINRRVNESGAAGLGSNGHTPPAPLGIKGSSAARANGESKEVAVRTTAAPNRVNFATRIPVFVSEGMGMVAH